MARSLRIEQVGACHHVRHRGASGQAVFVDDVDRRSLLHLVGQAVERYGIEVYAFCLMANHYHLLVRTPEANLGRAMRHINGVYTQRFNRRHGRSGALFDGRYRSKLVEDDVYLLWLSRYIHQNPVKAQLVDDASQFPWSSMPGYARVGWTPSWLDQSPILAFFDGDRERYRVFACRAGDGQVDAMVGDTPAVVMGSKQFVQSSLEGATRDIETDPSWEQSVERPSLELIEAAVAVVFAVSVESLFTGGRGFTNVARDAAVLLGQRDARFTQAALADRYGYRNYRGISAVLRRLDRALESDEQLRTRISATRRLVSAGLAGDPLSQNPPAPLAS